MAEDIREVHERKDENRQGQGQKEEKRATQNSRDHSYLRGYLKKRNYHEIAENLTINSNGCGWEFQFCYLLAV